METKNGIDVVGMVPRAVALALAFVVTASTSLGTTVLLTTGAAQGGTKSAFAIALTPLQALFGG